MMQTTKEHKFSKCCGSSARWWCSPASPSKFEFFQNPFVALGVGLGPGGGGTPRVHFAPQHYPYTQP